MLMKSVFMGLAMIWPPIAMCVSTQHTWKKSLMLIDGHNDFAIWIRAFYFNHLYTSNFSDTTPLYGQVDFPRLQLGGLSAQFWSVYVMCPPTTVKSREPYYLGVHQTLQQIDVVKRLISTYPTHLKAAHAATDIVADFQSGFQGISSLLGVEGLHQIGDSASILRLYHSMGVRYVTLTHTCHNKYADSEEPSEPLNRGLSKDGVALIGEMNRLGMMVDLSHTSFTTQKQALAVTKSPVIYSHSSAYSICAHSRNVPDDLLWKLKENGGIIMITFYPEYTNCQDPKEATMENVADHIEYVGGLIGYDHVGIGSDFDGMPNGPDRIEDVSQYPALIEELLRRGLALEDIEKVAGENIVRVLKDNERVADEMRDVRPLEDDVESMFINTLVKQTLI